MPKPNYAGFWMRLLAWLIDCIVFLPLTALQFYLFFINLESMMYLVSILSLCLVVWLDGEKGGTPGKLLLSLAIVNDKGKYIGIPNAIFRYIGKMASGIILGIGYLMISWDPKKQGLHDRIVKTYVVFRSSLK